MLQLGGNKLFTTSDRLNSLEKRVDITEAITEEQDHMIDDMSKDMKSLVFDLKRIFGEIKNQAESAEKRSEKRFEESEKRSEKRFDRLENAIVRMNGHLILIFVTIIGSIAAVYFK